MTDRSTHALELLPHLTDELFVYDPKTKKKFEKHAKAMLEDIPEEWRFTVLSDLAWMGMQNSESRVCLEYYTPEMLEHLEHEKGKETADFIRTRKRHCKEQLAQAEHVMYQFFAHAGDLVRTLPEHYEPFTRIGTTLLRRPDEALAFFTNGPDLVKRVPKAELPRLLSYMETLPRGFIEEPAYALLECAPFMLETFPEHYEQCLRIGKQMTDSPACFFKIMPKVLKELDDKDIPRVLNYTQNVAENEGYTAQRLFERSPAVLKLIPDQYEAYNDIVLKYLAKEDFIGEIKVDLSLMALEKLGPPVRTGLIDATHRLMDHDPDAGLCLFEGWHKLVDKLDPSRSYTPDELLIEYLPDRQTAQKVSGLIDMQRYNEPYMRKWEALPP